MTLDPDPRFRTAIHEAGHVIAHISLGVPFRYVTLRPRTPGVAGHVYMQPDPYSMNRRDDSDIIIYLAGALAEARLAWITSSESLDLNQLELDYYKAETSSSDYRSTPIPADSSIEAHWDATHELVESRWPEVQRVASVLCDRFTLTSKEVKEICMSCDDRPLLARHGLLTRAETRREAERRQRVAFEAQMALRAQQKPQ